MTENRMFGRARMMCVVLAVALAASCVPQATRLPPVVPASPCDDASYLALRQPDVDSLSAREWHRLQTLDRQCAAAPERAARAEPVPTQMWQGGRHWMMGGIATGIMVAMMIAMR